MRKLLLSALLLLTVLSSSVYAQTPTPTPFPQPDGRSFPDYISPNGRYILFTSYATNMLPGEIEDVSQLYLFDTELCTLERISVSTAGDTGDQSSFDGMVTPDGRYVAYYSYATNLVAGDTNDVADIFLRDRNLDTTVRLSVSSLGAQGDSDSVFPTITDNGRYVSFGSFATNLVVGDTNDAEDIFIRDTIANTTIRISLSNSGAQSDGDSNGNFISADGTLVAFDSTATNLVVGDTNNRRDVFVRNVSGLTTVRVSLGDLGQQGNNNSFNIGFEPGMSLDKQYVAFDTNATNLITGDANPGNRYKFLRDTSGNTTLRFPGVLPNGFTGSGSAYTYTGDYLGASSRATNLVPGDTNGFADIFVYPTDGSDIFRVSLSYNQSQSNDDSFFVRVSETAQFVIFESIATNLIPVDTNGLRDVFLRDTVNLTTVRIPDYACSGAGTPTPSPTRTRAPTRTPTPTPTITPTRTATPTKIPSWWPQKCPTCIPGSDCLKCTGGCPNC